MSPQLRATQKRRFRPRTTDSRHLCPIAPNHLAARVPAKAPDRVRALRAASTQLRAAGLENLDAAEKAIAQAVKLAPDDMDTLIERGLIHLLRRHFEPARVDFQEVVAATASGSHDRMSTEARIGLITALSGLGRDAEAGVALEDTLAWEDSNATR